MAKIIHAHLVGRGSAKLNDTNYITAGGEGAIYKVGTSVVKIYSDPAKMLKDDMPGKIRALGRLQRVGIVAPEGLVVDEHKQPLGFYMPFVSHEPLSRFFVSDYRNRVGFSDKDSIDLTADMHSIVEYAHEKKAVMVDANELNWLVGFTKGSTPAAVAIDVDSWAIGKWGASAIMPSIRDWSSKGFNESTDWFAWGVVSFQVFTGIHPFKGKIDGYKPGDMVQRMKDGASVFDKRAKLPLAVRDFSCIPGPLLDWYQATFQQALREKPPHPYNRTRPAKAAQVMRAVTKASSGGIVFEKLFERAGDAAVRTWPNGAVRLASGDTVDLATGKTIVDVPNARGEIVRHVDGWLAVMHDKGLVGITTQFINIHGQPMPLTPAPLPLAAKRVFRASDRIFAITDREMVEIERKVLGRGIVTLGNRWQVMTQSTTWLDDVAVTDVMGSAFVIMVTADGVHQVRVPELDGAKLVAGKAAGRFAAFAAVEPDGSYRKIEFTFDRGMKSYTAWAGPADTPDLNMGILSRGVVATIVDDFELVIMVPSSGAVNRIKDSGISTAMKLATWGEKIVYIADGAVWQMRVK